MKSMPARGDNQTSITALRFDLITAQALVWVVSIGRDVELTSEAHVYLFDRYQRLADYHRRRGHSARARRLQQKADEHRQFGGGDPPRAAAMALPRPTRWVATNAVSRPHHPTWPDDAA